jgi:hypothetical protein
MMELVYSISVLTGCLHSCMQHATLPAVAASIHRSVATGKPDNNQPRTSTVGRLHRVAVIVVVVV